MLLSTELADSLPRSLDVLFIQLLIRDYKYSCLDFQLSIKVIGDLQVVSTAALLKQSNDLLSPNALLTGDWCSAVQTGNVLSAFLWR